MPKVTVLDYGSGNLRSAVRALERAGPGVQLALPVGGAATALDAALDEIRDRFGADAVTRAALLSSGPRLSAWLLPGDQPASPADAPTPQRGGLGRNRS